MKLTTTITRLRGYRACPEGVLKLVKFLGDDFDPDREIDMLSCLSSNGVADTVWALRATLQDSKPVAVEIAMLLAEAVLPLVEQHFPEDARPRKAAEAAAAYAEASARSARSAAAYAARSRSDAARSAAAYAARSGSDAARSAAYAATCAARAADAAADLELSVKLTEIVRSKLQ